MYFSNQSNTSSNGGGGGSNGNSHGSSSSSRFAADSKMKFKNLVLNLSSRGTTVQRGKQKRTEAFHCTRTMFVQYKMWANSGEEGKKGKKAYKCERDVSSFFARLGGRRV